jgi:hypothetical protein
MINYILRESGQKRTLTSIQLPSNSLNVMGGVA